MPSYRVRKAASTDLYEAGLERRRAGEDAEAVECFLAQLVQVFDLLAVMPEMGTACDEVGPGWKCLRDGAHALYYRLTPEQIVDIVRVLPQRMDLHDREGG